MGALDDLLDENKNKSDGGALDALLGDNQPQAQDDGEKSIFDIAKDVGSTLLSPASAALEAISYLDKPRGAIAGGVNALLDNTDLVEGIKKGWDENTSWKEALPDQFKEEHPTLSSLAGFVGDVVLDPTWLVTPAKIGAGLAKTSKAVGLTDNLINPAINAVKNSETGAKVIAGLEDVAGVNRLAKTGLVDDFNRGRSLDNVLMSDITDELHGAKKALGNNFDDITKYVEAADRPAQTVAANADDVLKAVDDGSVFTKIKNGELTREQAFETLRQNGREIPDQLLQTHQRQAQIAKEAIPDYVYRDEILNQIPDETVRKQIQTLGDKIAGENKTIADKMYNAGRIGDGEFVEFLGGSHLRRSYEKFESADDFLKSVRKNGTEEEWQKAYTDFQKNKSGIGPSATHKIDQRDFMKRQNLSEETMKKMGLVTDPEYRVMDTLNRASKTLREDDFLTQVNSMFGKTAEEAAQLSRNLPKSREYIPIPDSKAYGLLAGKWVPKDVANQVLNITGTKAPSSELAKSWQKLVSWWKVGKLAAPAPIARNFYSGLPMANVFGQVPMKNIPVEMGRVMAAWKNGGKNNPLIRELRSSGALDGQWVKGELGNILSGNKKNRIANIAEKGMDAFGAPDKFWRAVVYSYHKNHGKSMEEAGKIARKALLDYDSAPEWINTLGKSGIVPFAKFPFLAGKETAKALWKNPAQVTKYTKMQNQVNNEDRQTIMPDYLKSRTLLPIGEGTRMVNGKPQKVQNNIDLSYILPFASDMSFGNPVTDAMMLAKTGRNGIGQEIIKPGMTAKEKALAWAEYAGNSIAPTVASPYTVEKIVNGYQGNVDSKGRQYDLRSALWQTLGGIKNVPINTQEMFTSRIKKVGMDINNNKAMISNIQRDSSMNEKQKKERIAEHVSQITELQKEAKRIQDAYKRETKKGGN